MRIKLFNRPVVQLYSWVEFGAGLSVIGGLAFSFFPF